MEMLHVKQAVTYLTKLLQAPRRDLPAVPAHVTGNRLLDLHPNQMKIAKKAQHFRRFFTKSHIQRKHSIIIIIIVENFKIDQ